MAVSPSPATAVSTTAVQLSAADNSDGYMGQSILLSSPSGTIYLGGSSSVTTSSGWPFTAALGPLALDLQHGEQLWAIAASAVTVDVLRVGA